MRRALLAIALVAGAVACNRPAPTAAPEAAAAGEADIALSRPIVRLGRTVAGGYVRGELEVKAGARPAVVTQVSPSCGCTIVDQAVPVELAAGATLATPVALDLSRLTDQGAAPPGSDRSIERKVAYVSQRGTRLEATVQVDVSGGLRAAPAQVRFASLFPGRQAAVDVAWSSLAGSMPVLESVETGPEIAWTPGAADERGLAGRLTWSPSAPGDLERFVTFRFGGPEGELALRVSGHCESSVVVDPQSIENLAASTRVPVVARVSLNRRDGRPLEILGASCTAHRVEVKVEPGTGPLRTVRVLVPVLAPPAEIQGTVTIRTDAEGAETVSIPVRVRASS